MYSVFLNDTTDCDVLRDKENCDVEEIRENVMCVLRDEGDGAVMGTKRVIYSSSNKLFALCKHFGQLQQI